MNPSSPYEQQSVEGPYTELDLSAFLKVKTEEGNCESVVALVPGRTEGEGSRPDIETKAAGEHRGEGGRDDPQCRGAPMEECD